MIQFLIIVFTVWYEPTDLLKANKPFKSSAWEKLTYISPNLNELRLMYSAARGYDQQAVDTGENTLSCMKGRDADF